jgi:hypothetical protein
MEHHTGEHRVLLSTPSPKVDAKVKAEVASAHIQASVQGRHDLGDLAKKLTDAHATIDRLLAFVPAKAIEVDGKRLGELVDGLFGQVEKLVPQARRTAIAVSPDLDNDSLSCHRIHVNIGVPDSLPSEKFVSASIALHDWLARNTTRGELQAIQLIVEPDMGPDSEPGRQS